eukprot:2769046-Rhodomonas_salina.1
MSKFVAKVRIPILRHDYLLLYSARPSKLVLHASRPLCRVEIPIPAKMSQLFHYSRKPKVSA